MDAAMKEIANVAFLSACVGSVVFLVLYSLVARWWRNPTGRVIFIFMAVITGIINLGGVRVVFGAYPGVTYIRPIAYVALSGAMWALSGILLYHQIFRRIKRK